MGQITTKKTSLVVSQNEVQDIIRKFAQHLPSMQKSVVLRTSKLLAELSVSERRAAMNIIKQQDKNGGLDYPWLVSFLTLLSKLKA